MKNRIPYEQARDLLLSTVKPVGTVRVPLAESIGMVLARDLTAAESVPPFDRSPYDGYALLASDTRTAATDSPVTLTVIEQVPAGFTPTKAITSGFAIKLLTGAPIPPGADAVVMYEKTEFTEKWVRIFSSVASGSNIVRAGEDICAGELLAPVGTVIGAGLAGALAAQGVESPRVYKRPRIAVISTGNEIVDVGGVLSPGKIFNSNRYIVEAALKKASCVTEYLGIAGDCAEDISALIRKALECNDAVVLTGGVSAGDFDLTPAAMELSGVNILVRGVTMKPGMACAYGVKDEKPVWALSGNPVAALVNLHAVVMPSIRKLSGRRDCMPQEITVELAEPFNKKSGGTRLLYGRLALEDGSVRLHISPKQGNVTVSATIGCDAAAVVPAGSGPLPAGTKLKGFIL